MVFVRERHDLSKAAKFIYFIVAVISMAGLASASIAMAENKSALSVMLFIVSFVIIAVAFVVKARLRNRFSATTSPK